MRRHERDSWAERKLVEPRAVRGYRSEVPQQVGGGRKRHAAPGLVPDGAKHGDIGIACHLGQQPRLPDPRLADDDGRSGLVAASEELGDEREFGRPPDEDRCHVWSLGQRRENN